MSPPTDAVAQGREAIRRTNLAATLDQVRRHGSLSRADLVPLLALGRTTVAELVTQLENLGLIVEGDALPTSGAGRPSYLIRPTPATGAIAVNPESDAITASFVGLDGEQVSTSSIPTPPSKDPFEVAVACAALVHDVAGSLPPGYRTVGIGVAIPGQVIPATGLVVNAPRLGWHEVAFGPALQDLCSSPVRIDNNARLVASTELRRRPRVRDLVYLFGGAGGVGAGVVSEGVLLRGHHGFAGEFGHLRITDEDAVDYGGEQGTIEAILRRDDLVAAVRGSLLTDDQLAARLADAKGYSAADNVIGRQVRALGLAIGNAANVFDPEIILLGGFLGVIFDAFESSVREAVAATALSSIAQQLTIEATQGMTQSAMSGAAELHLGELTNDPLRFTAA